MVGNSSSFICGGSIIGGITLLLLQSCLPINVVASIAIEIEDNHYHLHNNKNKHNDDEQQATIISRRRRRRRRTASNNNNDNVDCAWHADMITRDGCTNDDNCKFICWLLQYYYLMSYSYYTLLLYICLYHYNYFRVL